MTAGNLNDALHLLEMAKIYADDGALSTAAERALKAVEILNSLQADKTDLLNPPTRRTPDSTPDGSWYKFGEYHWYKVINGERLHYWPTTGKYQFKGHVYLRRSALPKSLRKYANQ